MIKHGLTKGEGTEHLFRETVHETVHVLLQTNLFLESIRASVQNITLFLSWLHPLAHSKINVRPDLRGRATL